MTNSTFWPKICSNFIIFYLCGKDQIPNNPEFQPIVTFNPRIKDPDGSAVVGEKKLAAENLVALFL